MSKLLVMTDLHLTPGAERINGLDPLERLRDGLDHAVRNHPDADHLILTGDLTHYGDADSYGKLALVLEDRPWPISFLIGNHDRRAAFLAAFPDCPTDPNGFVQSAVDAGDVRLITLDSVDEDGIVAEHAGHLCAERLDWLAGQLQAAGDRPCVLFLHHPPFKTGFKGMDDIRLMNDTAFLDVVQEGPVAHIFAGHVHRTIVSSARNIPATIFKSTCHQMPMLLGAAGSSHSVDEPGAYGIVLTDGANVVVHFEDFTLATQTVGSSGT